MLEFFRHLRLCVSLVFLAGGDADWPQFRGPDGQGHADAKGLPLTWSEKENIAWKVEVPGLGWSSPVIQGQRIWLTTASTTSRRCGSCAWTAPPADRSTMSRSSLPKKLVGRHGEEQLRHADARHRRRPRLRPLRADGDGLPVHRRAKSCGRPCCRTTLYYGPSSSPVLFEDLLIVPCQGTDVRYVTALDKKTGKERWKTPCGGDYNSDATPLVIRVGKVDQLVCNLTRHRGWRSMSTPARNCGRSAQRQCRAGAPARSSAMGWSSCAAATSIRCSRRFGPTARGTSPRPTLSGRIEQARAAKPVAAAGRRRVVHGERQGNRQLPGRPNRARSTGMNASKASIPPRRCLPMAASTSQTRTA